MAYVETHHGDSVGVTYGQVVSKAIGCAMVILRSLFDSASSGFEFQRFELPKDSSMF